MAVPLGCWHMHTDPSPPVVELNALTSITAMSPIPDISDLFTRQALQVFFGTAGNITGLLCLFAPLPTFARIIRKRSTEKFSALPYVVAMLSAAIWTLYASPMLANSFQVLTISLLSMIVQGIYVAIFVYFAREAALKGAFINLAGASGVFLCILALAELYEPASARAAAVGLCGDVLGVASFAAPLSVLGLVIRTKSAEYLPITLVVYMAMNGIMWTSYAMTIKDIFVFLPNALGVLLSAGQIILYMIYRAPPQLPLPMDAVKPTSESTTTAADSMWPKLHVKIAKPYLDSMSGMSASPRLIAPLLIKQLSHTISMLRDSSPSTPTMEYTGTPEGAVGTMVSNGPGLDQYNSGNSSPAIVYRDGCAYVVKALESGRRPRYRMRASSMQPRQEEEYQDESQQPLLTDFSPDWQREGGEDESASGPTAAGSAFSQPDFGDQGEPESNAPAAAYAAATTMVGRKTPPPPPQSMMPPLPVPYSSLGMGKRTGGPPSMQ